MSNIFNIITKLVDWSMETAGPAICDVLLKMKWLCNLVGFLFEKGALLAIGNKEWYTEEGFDPAK